MKWFLIVMMFGGSFLFAANFLYRSVSEEQDNLRAMAERGQRLPAVLVEYRLLETNQKAQPPTEAEYQPQYDSDFEAPFYYPVVQTLTREGGGQTVDLLKDKSFFSQYNPGDSLAVYYLVTEKYPYRLGAAVAAYQRGESVGGGYLYLGIALALALAGGVLVLGASAFLVYRWFGGKESDH